jgi:hypothetical protein
MTELLIGMILLSMLVVMVGTLLTNVTRMQHRVIDLTELNSLIDNVTNPLIRELSNAAAELRFCDPGCPCDGSTCPPDCPTTCPCNCAAWGGVNRVTFIIRGLGPVTYSVNNEGVMFRTCDSPDCPIVDCIGHPVLSKEYYKFRSVNFVVEEATVGTGTSYVLTVTITADEEGGRELIVRDYAVKPFVLNQYH